MIERFSDYEQSKYLSEEGEFEFEITDAELKQSKSGSDMWVFKCKSDAGETTIYHTLNPKARWSLNNLIRACMRLTPEVIKSFELDYETIGRELVGKTFIGTVKAENYEKEVKVQNDDGTFDTTTETKTSYKIEKYAPAEPLPFK